MSTERGNCVPDVCDYERWLARVQKLMTAESDNSWALGDLLVEGDDEFNVAKDIPQHLLIHKKNDGSGECESEKLPNFWKDVAEITGAAIQTLKEKVRISRQFPNEPGRRFPQLSYSHHRYASGFERRFEYLQACIVKGEKPKPVDWLWALIRKNEYQETSVIQSSKYLRFQVPEEMWRKLRDVAHYYKRNVPEITQKACLATLQRLLDEQAEKISLALFDIYEGRWPFDAPVAKVVTKARKMRRRARRGNDPVFSEQRRQIARARWSRNERVA